MSLACNHVVKPWPTALRDLVRVMWELQINPKRIGLTNAWEKARGLFYPPVCKSRWLPKSLVAIAEHSICL
jgi:hypothetical protein